MDPIRKILVPTDFSKGATAATEHALLLAHAFGASVTLFHVYSVPSYVFPDGSTFVAGPDVASKIERDVMNGLSEAARAAEQQSAVPVLVASAIGTPQQEIIQAGREFDLIVMGTHGRSGLRHFLLGSVAEKVVRHASCPVLTVRVAAEAHPQP